MENSDFWLAAIDDSSLFLSYKENQSDPVDWFSSDPDSFINALDQSLSSLATNLSLPEEEEPSQIAFIIPPFWVNSDKHIVPDKLKTLLAACKKLDLKAIGFIPHNDALIEYLNNKDGCPASFISLYFDKEFFTLTLAYLGKIKEIIRKPFGAPFTADLIEEALNELKSDSTLPPQIYIMGHFSPDIKTAIAGKNFTNFMQLPEIKYITNFEATEIFYKTILKLNNIDEAAPSEEEPIQEPESITPDSFVEVDPLSFGFESVNADPEPEMFVQSSPQSLPEPEPELIPVEIPQVAPQKPKRKFKIKFNFKNKLKLNFWPFAFLPLLFLIPLFFFKSRVILYATPYEFSQSFPIKLEVDKNVSKKTIDVSVTASLSTTGQKVVGNKAQGTVVVFNNQDKAQSLPKGTILTTDSGLRFELMNTVEIAAATLDLSQGLNKLGQTKASISAVDIGPEYNLNADTQLKVKDFSSSLLICKVTENIVGGSRDQIAAVSKEDKANLETKIRETIKIAAQEKVNQELTKSTGVIESSIVIKQIKIEYTREIGEEANELSATANASVSAFIMSPIEKEKMIKNFFVANNDFKQSLFDINNIETTFTIDKVEDRSAVAQVNISGKLLPAINIADVKKRIFFKTKTSAQKILKNINRVYKIDLKSFYILPLRLENIYIDVKL